MERSLDEVAEGKLDWERYLIGWNQSYLAPALVRARESLKTVSRVAPERKFGRGRRAGKTQGLEKNKRKRGKKSIAGSVPPTKSARASTRKPSRRTLSRASKSPQNPGDLGTPASRLEATAQARLDSAAAQARSFDRMPKCPDGHGEMVPRLSKKGAVYWKCGHTGCEAFAWNQEFSEHKCPDCGSPMEKISTPKVTGGYFLKCNARDRHAKEIVLFRNRKTLDWEKGR